MTELYRQVRPKSVEGLVGQPEAVDIIRGWVSPKDVPHAVMLYGPSGCGKTTTARIVRRKVKCHPHDYKEINCATETGIAMVRRMDDVLRKVAMAGRSRLWVLDEAHMLSGQAQNGLLKILEEAPKHAYVILATTDPQKLIKTIHTRCTKIKLEAIPDDALTHLVKSTWAQVGRKAYDEVVDRIVEVSDGSARAALVNLDGIRRLKTKEDMLNAVFSTDHKKQAIDLARVLVKPRPNWKEVAALLKDLADDAEGTRRLVLGYANSVMLGGGPLAERCAAIYDVFRDMFLNGKPDLTAACFAVCRGS